MKISTASKKVLASALSAAMVVAFAPTVAFGTDQATTTATAKVVVATHDGVTGTPGSKETSFYGTTAGGSGLQMALDSVKNGYITVKAAEVNSSGVTSMVNAVLLLENKTNGNKGEIIKIDSKVTFSSGAISIASSPTVLDTVAIDSVTVQMLADTADNVTYAGTNDITIDLGGFTLANDADTNSDGTVDTVANQGATSTYVPLTISASTAKVTVKNGTVKPTALTNAAAATDPTAPATLSPLAISETAGATTLEGITAEGDISLDGTTSDTIKNGAFKKVTGAATYKGVVTTGAIDGSVDLYKAAELTVTAESSKNDVIGIDASASGETVTLADASKLTVSATTSAKNKFAKGIVARGLAVGNWAGEGNAANVAPTVSVTATSTSRTNDSAMVAAIGVETPNVGDVTVANGTLEVSATAADADATAIGVMAGIMSVTDKGTATVSGSAVEEKNSYAFKSWWDHANAKLSAVAGKYTGKIARVDGTGEAGALGTVTGGSYTVKPVADVNYASATHEVVDDGTYWTVQQYAGYSLGATVKNGGVKTLNAGELAAVKTAVENALAGKSGAATLKMAGTYTMDDLKAQSKKTGNEKLAVYYSIKEYKEKTATEAETAAYKAIKAWAEQNSSVTGTVYIGEAFVGFTAKGATEPTVMAQLADFGTTTTGRATEANLLTYAGNIDEKDATANVYVASDGTSTTKIDYMKDEANTGKFKLAFSAMPFAFASTAIDPQALKDLVNGGGAAPVEKATQSIDVAQKSKTVKLAKGKAKTQKAVSFKLGASAETGLTIAKKSGSSRISVSGQKVTLKKGTKKGTFTAKVSLKAAASDEFLAAAKTITVKFVVKK